MSVAATSRLIPRTDRILQTGDFDFIRDVVKGESGLDLGRDKVYLLESRLKPLMDQRGIADLSDLAQRLRTGERDRLARDIAEAMTTNESFFFRDTVPFNLFRDEILPALMAKRVASKSLRIWCAAASTGQEPYSLAILLKEQAAKLAGWKVEILATDISVEALARARAGVYNPFEIQRGLPPAYLQKYFHKTGENWTIDSEIKAMVRFEERNLLDSPRGLGQFDVVFCRNVLIYFDAETKRRVLANIRALMPDDGVLFLGGAETVLGYSAAFRPASLWNGVYRPTPSAAASAVMRFPARAKSMIRPS
jgi:chemotaxis protein methyltransferase CheR